MSNTKLDQAAPVSPLLSKFAQSTRQPDLIGTRLLPEVSIKGDRGQIPIFGNDFFKQASTKRAPFASVASGRIEAATYRQIELEEYSYKIPIDRRQLENGDPVRLKKRTTESVTRHLLNGQEQQIADAVQDDTKYSAANKATLSGTSQWTHDDADPVEQINDYILSVQKATGIKPNMFWFGAEAWKGFRNNLNNRERVKYTKLGMVTLDIAKELLEISNIVIGGAIKAGSSNTFIWGDNAGMAYVTPNPDPDGYEPSFGYTFKRNGYPITRETTDQDGNVLNPTVYMQYDIEVMNYDAAFILKDTNA